MMSKLAANNEGTNKQFKPKIFQSRRRGQTGNFYDKHNYKQRNYHIRVGIDHIVEIGEIRMDKITEVDQGMNKTIGMTLEEETLEVM